MDLGTAPDLIFHKLWGRAAWLAGAGEKHRCGDGAPLIGPATERSGQRGGCEYRGRLTSSRKWGTGNLKGLIAARCIGVPRPPCLATPRSLLARA